MKYKIYCKDEVLEGHVLGGEIKLIKLPYESFTTELFPGKGLDLGQGKDIMIRELISGGEVGILLDCRGRKPFHIPNDMAERVRTLLKWSSATNEYIEDFA